MRVGGFRRTRTGGMEKGALGRPSSALRTAHQHRPLSSASALSSQKLMSISRYIVAAVVRCSLALTESPVRRWSLPSPRWQSASSGEKMWRSTFSSSPVPVLVGNRCASVSKVRPVSDKCLGHDVPSSKLGRFNPAGNIAMHRGSDKVSVCVFC
jgi:hypothetical protein